MGEHLYTYVDPPNRRDLDAIVEAIRLDGVIAMPGGTNWVFAADPRSKKAMQRMVRLKPDHPTDRPFALMAADIPAVTGMASVDGGTYKLLKRIWPGPFTVLLKSGRELPRILLTKRKVIGVRVPSDPLAQVILEAWGGPLMISTVPSTDDGQCCTLGYEVFERFGNDLDYVVDLGEELPGTTTTVLDVSDGELEVIREGAGDLSLL